MDTHKATYIDRRPDWSRERVAHYNREEFDDIVATGFERIRSLATRKSQAELPQRLFDASARRGTILRGKIMEFVYKGRLRPGLCIEA